MKNNSLEIPLRLTNDKTVILKIFADIENSCFEIDETEAEEFGEARYQLLEGCSYEYSLNSSGIFLEEIDGITKRSKASSFLGRITPGIYTGTLKLRLFDDLNIRNEIGHISLEIRSIKASYRDDYRLMLEEITEKCTELILQHTSPVTQLFETNFEKDSITAYQKFSFIKSIIISDDFQNACHKIVSSPVVRWDEDEYFCDIRNARRFNRKQLQQIASGTKRIKTPENLSLKNKLNSLPEKIIVKNKCESYDTQENRFIKHALTTFSIFISSIKRYFKEDSRESKEAFKCENILNDYLGHTVFRDTSSPQFLGLNSPILQRKEGYREVYKAWLMFELASKLVWTGGNDVYEAGKRDVATLYEYWLYFKLLEMLQSIFNIESKTAVELIEETNDGLSLKLKAGKHIPLTGVFQSSGRNLKVQFSYNRTFMGNTPYPKGGSWSMSMRPDYTLSIWPVEFSEEEAERQELVIHIHFDAKYKVENIYKIFGDELSNRTFKNSENEIEDNLNKEINEQKKGIYKRVDLLKMHSYKDAVRRTVGAYVLYPGSKSHTQKGFHELIPGLGAFIVKPSKSDTGISELSDFIRDVLINHMSRVSQHSKMSYYTYDIHRNNENLKFEEAVPEKYNNIRSKPPTDIHVLVGYFQKKQKEWIEKNNLYNIRFKSKIKPEFISAKYILLYGDNVKTNILYQVIEDGPEILSKDILKSSGYLNPSEEEYFVYKIRKVTEKEFENKTWDVSKLYGYDKFNYLPFSVSLFDLMKVAF